MDELAGPPLFVAVDWIERHCVVPDGFAQGEPFKLVDWQAWCLLNHYMVRPDATVGQLAPAFQFRRSQIVMPQKAGKGPLTAAQVALEAVGPCLFAGWAVEGDRYRCAEHGCRCGWEYRYDPGEAMGRPWPTPLIQITATSEDQTDNIYDAFVPMVKHGPLADLIPKVGTEFTRLPNGGRIDTVTASAQSRLGNRVTFVAQDETGIWTHRNGMVKVAETQRRGLAGMGGRSVETLNAWDLGEESVGKMTAESAARDVFRWHRLPPAGLDYLDPDDRKQIHAHVYAGSPWVDLDAIEAEAAELIERDPGQAERFFGNRPTTGSGKAFNLAKWEELGDQALRLTAGEKVAVGFDGSRFHDATAIIVCSIDTGTMIVAGLWENDGSPDWQVPEAEVDATMAEVFSQYRVVRCLADPPYWTEVVERWQGRWGRKTVIDAWTNKPTFMCWAVRRFVDSIAAGEIRHDGDPDLARHVGNCQRHEEKVRDEDGLYMWTVRKETEALKIDAAVAAILAWKARGDAIAEGALTPEPQHMTVGFGGRRR